MEQVCIRMEYVPRLRDPHQKKVPLAAGQRCTPGFRSILLISEKFETVLGENLHVVFGLPP